MRLHFVTLLFLICFASASAQKKTEMDSLAARLPHVKDVSQQIQILATLSEYNASVNPAEGIRQAQTALNLAKGSQWNPQRIKLLRYMGICLKNQGNLTEALKFLFQSLALAEQLSQPEQVAFTKRQLALTYKDQRNKAQAEKVFLEVLDYYEKTGSDRWLSTVLIDMGGLYSDHGELQLAKQYYERALELAVKTRSVNRITTATSNLGNIYGGEGNYRKAIEYYSQALKLAQDRNDTREENLAYGRIGFEYLNYLSETKPVDAAHRPEGDREFHISKAIEYIEKTAAYLKQSGQINEYQTFMRALPEAYFLGKQYEKGIDAFKAYYESKENTMQKQNERDLARTELNYEFARKRDSAQAVQQRKELQLENEMKVRELNHAFEKKQQADEAEKERLQLQFSETLKRKGLEAEYARSKQRIEAENQKRVRMLWLMAGVTVTVLLILYLFRAAQFARKKAAMENEFSQNLVENIEQERKRIAEELHDSVGQGLLVLKNNMHRENGDTQAVDEIIGEVRGLSQNMHPYQFERLGLIRSLAHTVETLQKSSSVFFSFECEDETLENYIDNEKRIHIYRMVQEALNNVLKHSKAKACRVEVYEKDGFVSFETKDNGVGFDLPKGKNKLQSLGMKTLASRAQLTGSRLDVSSEPGKGTSVLIQVTKSKSRADQ